MNEKKIAAEYAVDYIEDGMIVGLGTGSTVSFMISKLAQRIKTGLNITAVSSSAATTKLASSLGIKISKLSDIEEIDLTIDGADEVDENLNGIKGGGGALLYEKIIAANSKKNIWIVDSSKLVKTLGKFPLPVEVVQFGSTHLGVRLENNGFRPRFRMNESIRFVTDNGNYILDLSIENISDPVRTDIKLKSFAGVVETGLFNGVADIVIAGIGNKVEVINKKERINQVRFKLSYPLFVHCYYLSAPSRLNSLDTFFELLYAKKPSTARKAITINSVIPILFLLPMIACFGHEKDKYNATGVFHNETSFTSILE